MRIAMAVIGGLCVIAGVLLFALPRHSGLAPLIVGVLILVSLAFEGRYRSGAATAGAWEQTDEKFIDPETGKLVEVDYDPQTGERKYRS